MVESCRESADQIVSLSGDSKLREWKIFVASECTGFEGLNNSRVVGGLLRKACEKVSEGVRVEKAQEGQFLVHVVGTGLGEI